MPGYKNTNAGLIPEAWVSVPLGKLGHWFSGGTPSKAVAEYWSGEIPWVSPKDMKTSRLHGAIDSVSQTAIGNGTRLLPAKAILVVVRGMILAHSAPVARAEVPLTFNQDIKALIVKEGVDSDYVLWWLVANKELLLSKTSESTHGTKRLPSEALFQLELPLPTKAEQEAIAEALSDADALIESIEALVKKKRLIKQGAMQELLTGKKRLPGFESKPGTKQTEVGEIPVDWDVTTVGAMASHIRNAIVGGPFGSDLVSADYVDQGVPVIRGQNLLARYLGGEFVFVSEAKASSLRANLARPGDLVFTQRGTLGQVCLIPGKPYSLYLVSQSQMKVTVDSEVVCSAFIYHAFTSASGQRLIKNGAIQTGVPHINLGILRRFPLALPPLPEQEAIAEILSDMDCELAALNAKLNKAQQIKQGMMHELLTGRIRLV